MNDKIKKNIDNQIIVSLTSFPARIGTVHITINSLLKQTFLPDKIILWLAPEQFPNKENDLPQELLVLKSEKFCIDWYKDIKSFKKLIPALKYYPDSIIVTADDDIIYNEKWLEQLINSYNKDPKSIHCHRITRLDIRNNVLTSQDRWGYTRKRGYLKDIFKPSAYNKLTGCAGVLYPPNCFNEDIFNETLFNMLTPTSDDIWFFFQALRNGYKVRVVKNTKLYILNEIPKCLEGPALCKINDNNPNGFKKQLNDCYNYYKNDLEKFFMEDFINNEKLKHKIMLINWIKTLVSLIFSIKNKVLGNIKYKFLTIFGFLILLKIHKSSTDVEKK